MIDESATAPPPGGGDPWSDSWIRARKAWPAFAIERDRFVTYLQARLPPEQDAARWLATAHVEDLYLACACVDQIPAAINAFDRIHLRRVGHTLTRLGIPAHLADEVQQLLRHSLLIREGETEPRLSRYSGSGPLAGWLHITAVREASHLTRKGSRDVASETINLSDGMVMDLETEYIKQHYRREFTEAFAEVLQSLPVRDQTILRLQIVEKMSIEQISAMFRIHRTTLWRWIGRIHEELLRRTRHVLAERLRVSEAEFDTILRLIKSQLFLTLEGKLEPKE